MIGGNLHNYLWGNSTSDGFSGRYGGSSSQGIGRQDALGRTSVYTMADLDAAGSTKDKLAVADELAKIAKLRIEAAQRTGRADTIAKVADEARQVVDRVFAQLDAERTGGGDADAVDPGVEPYASAAKAVLSTYGEVAIGANALRGKLSGDALAAFDTAVKGLDTGAQRLADLVKGKWTATAAETGFRPDPTKLVDILV